MDFVGNFKGIDLYTIHGLNENECIIGYPDDPKSWVIVKDNKFYIQNLSADKIANETESNIIEN